MTSVYISAHGWNSIFDFEKSTSPFGFVFDANATLDAYETSNGIPTTRVIRKGFKDNLYINMSFKSFSRRLADQFRHKNNALELDDLTKKEVLPKMGPSRDFKSAVIEP